METQKSNLYVKSEENRQFLKEKENRHKMGGNSTNREHKMVTVGGSGLPLSV